MYMNQRYNKTVVEGHGGMIHSNIFVAEGKYKINKKLTLRGELQYLTTKQDQGDWAFALLELSWLPNWMFTVSDKWNCGETDLHYYQGLVTFNYRSHRIQAGYGRTRAVTTARVASAAMCPPRRVSPFRITTISRPTHYPSLSRENR